MNFRKFIAILAAIAAFFAVGLLASTVAGNAIGAFAALIGSIAASFVYNLIKGDEPEIKEKKGITSKEISKMLAEKREKREKKIYSF
ncbi:MAG: hypothetical protein PQ964_03925 [Methanobacteriaceae archaeon]|jgi:hypothetical protein